MRTAIATIIGGLVMFIWGAFAHMVLPIGEMSMGAPVNEDKVLSALKDGLPAERGIYVLPHFDMSKSKDPKARAAYSEKTAGSPYAFIVYAPYGLDSLQMGGNLFHQWLSNTLAACVLAVILIRIGAGRSRGALLGWGMGVFCWLSISVPYWNWYRFPDAFTVGALVEMAIGWMLAGGAMGWWLVRGQQRGYAAIRP